MHLGCCTDHDYELLLQHTVGSVKPDWSDPNWSTAPVIVYENAIKDVVNEEYAHTFLCVLVDLCIGTILQIDIEVKMSETCIFKIICGH